MGIASPLFFGWIYSLSSDGIAGLSFFIAAAILFLGAGLGFALARRNDPAGA